MISEDTISPLNTTSNHASKPSTSRPRRGTISLPKIEIFEPSNTFEKAEELDIQKRPGRLEAIKAIKTIEKNETASLFKMEADIIAKNYSKLDKLPVATSIIEEFKVFRQELKHPAVIMNVLTESDDDQVVTEFDSLCNELLECLGELEHSLLEFTEWKNEFLDQSAPGALKLQITLLFCKLFRSKSNFHAPLFELVKQVRIYSRPWINKKVALLELENDYNKQRAVLDSAIRKIEHLDLELDNLRNQALSAKWAKVIMANDRARDNDESHNKIILKKTLMGDPKPDILNESATSHTIEKQPNIKTALREYIATDIPSWKKNPQDTMRKFGRILRQQHPNIEENLRIIHANPYYQSSSKYYSSKSDSFEVRTLNKKEALGLRKSWSLLNLKSFKNRTGIQLDYLDKTENISTGLVRTNSFNTRHDLKSAKIRNPIFNKFSTQKSRRSSQKSIRNLNGSSVFPPQNIINYFDAQCSSSEESSDDGDQNSEFDFKEILNGKEQTDLHNTIVKFFGAETLKWDSALNQPEGSSAQSSAAAFSMKDVMELTLLHAEQMQVLSSEYETRMYEVEQQIQRKDEENKKVILDYQVKLEEAEIKTQRLILSAEIRRRTEAYREEQGSKKVQLERADSYGKIVRKSREDVDVETDHLHRSGGSNENENLRRLHDILKNHESKFTPDDNAGGKQHNSQHNNRIHHQSRKDSFNDHPSRKDSYNDSTPRYRRQSIIRSEAPFIPKKPVFSGEQFALGFLDRLKWFTESKLRNQIALKEEIKSMQNESNEKRLYQLGLLNSERKPAISSGFNAEFMPMPGNVQGPKKDLLPWGGAFRSSPKKRTQDFSNNVLNLFSESSRMENLKKEDGKKI